MHSIKKIKRYFPLIIHWTNLNAFMSLVLFALGIATASVFSRPCLLFSVKLYPILKISATVCVITGIVVKRKMVFLTAFYCAGLLVYTAQSIHWNHLENQLLAYENRPVTIAGTISTTPVPYKNGFRYLLLINTFEAETKSPFNKKTFLCTGMEYPSSAYRILAEGIMTPGKKGKNPYEFDESEFFRANGIAGRIDVQHILKDFPPETISAKASFTFRSLVHHVLKSYRNPDHRALVLASFTGEKKSIDPEITKAFIHSGLIHLLALSGLHAGILLAAVYCILLPFPVSGILRHGVALGVLWAYSIFIGPLPSFNRAVLMTTMIIVSIVFQRKSYSLQLLGIAGICWLALSPFSLFQPGFQLSYMATFGILVLYPLINKLYKDSENQVVNYIVRIIVNSLSISGATFLMTLPIVAYHFGSISLYGIVANIAAIPLMTGTMWCFFAALPLYGLLPIVSNMLIAASGGMIDILLGIANLSGKIPCSYCSVPVPYPELILMYYVVMVMIITIDRNRLRVTILIVIPTIVCLIAGDCLVRRIRAGNEIVFFPVKGCSAVMAITLPSGRTGVVCRCKKKDALWFLQKKRETWLRRYPGTSIDKQITINDKNQLVESNASSVKRTFNREDTIVLSGRCSKKDTFVCKYIPEQNKCTLSAWKNVLAIHLNEESMCGGINYGKEKDTLLLRVLPVRVVMRRNRYSVQQLQ